jgi:hypothetical protein
VSPNTLFAVRRIEITSNQGPSQSPGTKLGVGADPLDVVLVCRSGKWRADISLHQRSDRQLLAETLESGHVRCVVGDSDEVRTQPDSPPYANATLVTFDVQNSTVRISTSVSGLPPVFVFHIGSRECVSCPFIPESARGSLQPDTDGIADTLRWGHPLNGRTLFTNLQVVSSDATVIVSSDCQVNTQRNSTWSTPQEFSSLTYEDIIHEQMSAFAGAVGRLSTENAFLSLSGGLDSRAVLIALLTHGRRIPCVTMAGSSKDLDACLARASCEAYGLQHHTVLLDATFYRQAPELLIKSAEVTGGVSCLSQTVDLFLYDSVPATFTARISGNLGNQVGRGGVESLSAHRPNPNVFCSAIRQRLLARPLTPWFIPRLHGKEYGRFLVGQEAHFSSISNYMIGSSRALQLTPYADRRLLILSSALFESDTALRHPTWRSLRARDLRHRLTGTRKARSFQRQFLARYDLLGSQIALNWGWRAAGGWSLGWGASGIASAADAAMIKLSSEPGAMGTAARWVSARLEHRSTLVDWPTLVKSRLRELARDTIASQAVRDSGVFDLNALDAMMNRHFNGVVDSHLTVVRALEIALGIGCRASAVGSSSITPSRAK